LCLCFCFLSRPVFLAGVLDPAGRDLHQDTINWTLKMSV
jgi:hypothetical protein